VNVAFCLDSSRGVTKEGVGRILSFLSFGKFRRQFQDLVEKV